MLRGQNLGKRWSGNARDSREYDLSLPFVHLSVRDKLKRTLALC